MTVPNSELPEAIVEAMRRGSIIEAIKLLRNAKGIGLKEAKDFIEAQRRGASAADKPADPTGPLPPPVANALQRGNKIEAIRLFRAHTGLGLKESKDAVDAAHQPAARRARGLSPGEVPQSENSMWWPVAVILAVVAVYFFLVGFG